MHYSNSTSKNKGQQEIGEGLFKQVSIFVLALLFLVSCSQSSSKSEDDLANCLIGYDWVYPNLSKPSGAWKFSKDGTFNSSTTAFGGMSTWGTWSIEDGNKVHIIYTRTTEGSIPGDQFLILSSCETLVVGSTTYNKF